MSLWNVSSILFFAFILLFSHASFSQGLVYEGTLYDADGVEISESGVNIKAELLDKDGNCVFYERAFVLDLSGSKGHFSLNLEDGTAPTGQPHNANTLSKVLSSSNTNSVKCSDGSDYDFTGTAEKRLLRLTVLEINSIDISDIVLPLQTLSILPFAKEAESSLSLRGVLLDSTAPSNGQVLRYNSTNSRYEPANVQATSINWASILGVPADIADGDADTTYNLATGAASGLMSSSDKSKLDGIETSATADQSAAEILTALQTVDGASSNLDADLLDGQSGAHYLAWGNLTSVPAGLNDGDDDTTYSPATTGANGLMSAADKTKLNGIASGAEVNVQADWNAGSGDAQILNKPTIPDGNSLDASDGSPTNALIVDASGNVGIGTPSPGEELEVDGDVLADAYLFTSDRRKKKNIETIKQALNKVLELRGVNFDWIESNEADIGLIAQEVEAVIPTLVRTNEKSGWKSVKYANLVGYLIEAIKEMKQEKDDEVAALRKENSELRERLDRLENLVKKLVRKK